MGRSCGEVESVFLVKSRLVYQSADGWLKGLSVFVLEVEVPLAFAAASSRCSLYEILYQQGVDGTMFVIPDPDSEPISGDPSSVGSAPAIRSSTRW